MTEPASIRAHAAVPFMNPLSEAAVDGAIAALALAPGATVLETGCGAAELLLRVAAAWPGVRATGVDPDPYALARARVAAATRGLAVELVEATADDAPLVVDGYDLVVNVASSHAHGGFPDALDELAALARPDGGHVLLGEGFWAAPPSAAFLEALGGATADELPLGLDALVDAAARAGLRAVGAPRVASADDWAAYEEGLAAAAERHEDAEAQEYAARIRARRALPEGTATLGFALLTLRR